MRVEEIRKMYELEDEYWWFVGRRAIIASLLDRHFRDGTEGRIADLGCGGGRNVLLLQRFGAAIGLDPASESLGLCRERGIRRLVGGRIENLPFGDGTMDLVTAFDVLEHVDDDEGAVRELARVLKPGGTAMLTVPAYKFLWSEHDEALDHRRRYTARQVRRLLKEAGLQPQRSGYCIMFLFGPILLFRALQRIKQGLSRKLREPATAIIPMPGPISRLFVWLLKVEARLLRWANLPFGVSVVVLARKPK